MKALVGAFNQEKALVGAFSVIVQPVVELMEHYTALVWWDNEQMRSVEKLQSETRRAVEGCEKQRVINHRLQASNTKHHQTQIRGSKRIIFLLVSHLVSVVVWW